MLQILGKILGSGDVVQKGLQLIDDMHTSTEEEIHAKSKAKTDLLQAYAPFKIRPALLGIDVCCYFSNKFCFSSNNDSARRKVT